MPKRKSNNTASAAAKSNDGNKGSNNEGSGAGDGDDDDDEVVVMWKKLQETQRKKMKHLEAETEQLQHEKETMLQSVMVASASSPDGTTIRDDDIIEIDAGGKILRALRSTLTLPSNTMWSYMFSGRWDESLKRDKDGRIFLDYDHDLIEIIVGYLREKKIEDPANPLKYPYVPPHRKESFQRLLQYFGLVDYFIPPSSSTTMIFSKKIVLQHEGQDYVTITESDNNTIELQSPYNTGHYGVACATELDPTGEGCFWKVNIDSLPIPLFFFLGIVGNLDLKYYVPNDATSFGWGGSSGVFCKGESENRKDGWVGFEEGECLYFHFKSNKLSMHSVQKNKTFAVSGVDTNATKFYIHTNVFRLGTAMTIGPLNAEERKTFG